MEKKDFKMYAAPEMELVEMELEGQLMAGSLDPDESRLPNPDENMED